MNKNLENKSLIKAPLIQSEDVSGVLHRPSGMRALRIDIRARHTQTYSYNVEEFRAAVNLL